MLIFNSFKLLGSVNLMDCQPHFLLHLLFAISRDQVNLRISWINHLIRHSLNLTMLQNQVSTSKWAPFMSVKRGWHVKCHKMAFIFDQHHLLVFCFLIYKNNLLVNIWTHFIGILKYFASSFTKIILKANIWMHFIGQAKRIPFAQKRTI